MSCESTTGTRSNFASRLLSKAMSERKQTSETAKPKVEEASDCTINVERKEAIGSAK